MPTPTFVLLFGRGRIFLLSMKSIDPSLGKPMDPSVAIATVVWLLAEPTNRPFISSLLVVAGFVGVSGSRTDLILRTIINALQRGVLILAEYALHPTVPFVIRKSGNLTLSEVSWGETSGLYPTKTTKPSEHDKITPSTWDDDKVYQLQKARAAIHDVGKRNSFVHKSSKFSKETQIFKPYHCIENFPELDSEIDEGVKWFYISSISDRPTVHPGTTGTKLVKSYGEFFCNGGGDVKKGGAYVHFYKLA